MRISGAQAAGCSPVAQAFAAGRDVVKPVKPNTIAKSLAIGNPADGLYALDAVRASGGSFGAVTDDEIVAGIRLLARTEGIFAETAGGVTIATLAQLAAVGRGPPRRAGRRLRDRQRAEDGRGGGPALRPDRDHRPHPGGLRGGRRHRRGAPSHGRHRPHPHPAPAPRRRQQRGAPSKGPPWPRCSRPWRRPTPASPTGCSTTPAGCAASSTCSWPTRTSASSTGSTPRAGRRHPLDRAGRRRRLSRRPVGAASIGPGRTGRGFRRPAVALTLRRRLTVSTRDVRVLIVVRPTEGTKHRCPS